MAISDTDLFGQDIALDVDWQPVILADGSLSLCAGCDTATQDLALRLYTMLGTLFYDIRFGSQIMLFVRDESTPLTRAALCAEVVRRINADPSVRVGSAQCTVLKWDESTVTLRATYTLITDTHPSNMVVSLDVATMTLRVADLVADADPR